MTQRILHAFAAVLVLTLVAPVSAQESTEVGPDCATSDEAAATPTFEAVDSAATAAEHPAAPTVRARGVQRAFPEAREREVRPLIDELSPTDQAELDSINTESTHATNHYIAAFSLLVVGGAVGTVFWVVAGSGDGLAHSTGWGTAAVFAWGIPGIGFLVLLPIAIGLDVDSGSRRGALEERRAEGVELTSVSVTPIDGGAALQLGGRF